MCVLPPGILQGRGQVPRRRGGRPVCDGHFGSMVVLRRRVGPCRGGWKVVEALAGFMTLSRGNEEIVRGPEHTLGITF